MDCRRNIVLIMFVLFYMVRAHPNTNLISVLCNNDAFDPNDGYRESVTDVLVDVIESTPNLGFSYYTARPAPNNRQAYGHGACYEGLSSADCAVCLGLAFPKILNGCPSRVGAQLQLQDCRLRYENYPFSES